MTQTALLVNATSGKKSATPAKIGLLLVRPPVVTASTSDNPSGRILLVNETLSLQQLVDQAVARHSTSVRQLGFMAKDHGFTVVGTTLSHIRAGRYKSVPTDDTIRAIAWLAGVSDEVAFTAAGQPVPGPPFAEELPPGVDNLSPKARKAVIEMLRVLVDAEAGSNADQDKAQTNPPGKRTLRAVGSSGEAFAGQKIPHPDDPDFETPPPIEQLAAHPYFKTEHEKFEEAYGERGEENQDPDDGQ